MSLEDRKTEMEAQLKEILANAEQEQNVDAASSTLEPTENVIPELTEIEKQAKEMGWDPNHQGKSFVSAEEYVRRGPLFDKIEKQNKDIRELRELMKQSTSHLAAVRKEAYERALQDLETARHKAIETGEANQVYHVENQVKTLQDKMSKDPLIHDVIRAPEPNEHEAEFSKRNAHWYNHDTPENTLMAEAARGFDQLFARKAAAQGKVLSPQEHLKAVEDAIRREFPHRFENPKKDEPAAVGRSTAPKETGKSGSSLVHRLTPQQRQLGEYFQKHAPKGSEYTLEMYAKDLEATGRLNK